MKSAQELRESKQAKLEQRLKENTERINMELVEIEKAQNKWESDLDDKKPYFEIPILIKTKEVKDLLAEQEYIIDKVSNDITLNTSRIWVDQEAYKELVKSNYTKPLNYSEYDTRIKPLSNINNDKKEIKENKSTTEECIDLYELLQRIGLLHKREESCLHEG
jgi:hypothetical protein